MRWYCWCSCSVWRCLDTILVSCWCVCAVLISCLCCLGIVLAQSWRSLGSMLVLCCGGGLTGLKVSRCLCTNMIGDVSEHQMLNLYIFIVNMVNIVTNIQHCISHRAVKNSHKNFLFIILCLFSHIILHHFPLLSLYCDDYVCSPPLPSSFPLLHQYSQHPLDVRNDFFKSIMTITRAKNIYFNEALRTYHAQYRTYHIARLFCLI